MVLAVDKFFVFSPQFIVVLSKISLPLFSPLLLKGGIKGGLQMATTWFYYY